MCRLHAFDDDDGVVHDEADATTSQREKAY